MAKVDKISKEKSLERGELVKEELRLAYARLLHVRKLTTPRSVQAARCAMRRAVTAHFTTSSKASGREVKDCGMPAEGVALAGLGVGVK